MKTRKLKNQLKTELETQVPDVYGKIVVQAEAEGLFSAPKAEAARKGERVRAQKQRNKKTRLGVLSSIAAVAACCAIVLPVTLTNLQATPYEVEDYTTVCVKINPCVEFTVQEEVVTSAQALNKDAAILLVDTSLVGLPVEEACLQFANLASASNLVTADGITVYVSGKDEVAVEEKITACLQENEYEHHRGGEAYEEDAKQLREQHKVSEGKSRLIAEILSLFPELDSAELAKLPSDELYDILEDYAEDEMESFESELEGEFSTQYSALVEEVRGKLDSCSAWLEELKNTPVEQRAEKLLAFSEEFGILDDDFVIAYDPNVDWEELIAEFEEEFNELKEGMREEPEKFFPEIFEEMRENFRQDKFDKHHAENGGGGHGDPEEDRPPEESNDEQPPKDDRPPEEEPPHELRGETCPQGEIK